ncbi:hypothetical protein AB7942_21715 [Neobacillus sp. BF23-41]|uniref:hypothetical protein n=1 Tax=Neobacillus sp. BF23-41 TaxID=3240280 RepID=UPI0034E42BB4
MKRDLQTIIKEAAARYGLEYNEKQTQPTIQRPDGTVDVISKENFYKAFGVTLPKAQEKWSEIPGEESVTWQNTSKVDFDLTEDMHFFRYNDKKIVA